MKPTQNNYAYIDAANLYRAVSHLGWQLDYAKFRVWLKEKYGVTRAYLFIGLVPKHKDLYTNLQEAGFTLVYKEVTYDGEGKVKGNCDADLVLKATRDAYENLFEQAILISSDGDYAGLVKFLLERGKFTSIISPSISVKCSVLLKRTGARIAYINDQRFILEVKKVGQKEKAPGRD
ncbi:MAG: NYN domain-containing protein [Candidatus Komeilibacteria bacterium]|nr:NYN domain-containing protein [Candidatus Komeilibacteria bacterium]